MVKENMWFPNRIEPVWRIKTETLSFDETRTQQWDIYWFNDDGNDSVLKLFVMIVIN